MKREPSIPKWTDEDVVLGEQFLELSKRFNGTFEEKRNAVAHALSGNRHIYQRYSDLPSGVLSFISSKAAEIKGIKKTEQWKAKMDESAARAEEEWYQLFNAASDADRAAMLHPEDDEKKYLVEN